MLNESALKLERLLLELDYKNLPISDYAKRYYAFDLRKLSYMLQSYVFMLLWSQFKLGKDWKEITLLDHGGGIGMLSFLAKIAGIKTVIHQDINPEISEDAKIISEAIKVKIDYFVTGNTSDFVSFVNAKDLKLNVIGSRNVIEHVYDLNLFFHETAQIKTDKLLLFLSTTANERNPLVNIYTKGLQRKYELKGSPVAWGEKAILQENSGLNQRKKIILDAYPDCDSKFVDEMARLTRGKIKEDILLACSDYFRNGNLPIELSHPSNTCAPDSGSWVEHLLPVSDYKKMIEGNGFTFSQLNGFYNTSYPQAYLNMLTPLLNKAIVVMGKNGISVAPFIALLAEK